MPMVQSAQIQFRYDTKKFCNSRTHDAVFDQLFVNVRGVDECDRNETAEM